MANYTANTGKKMHLWLFLSLTGGIVTTFVLRALSKGDFFVFNIVPSARLNDSGTGVSG